MADNGKSLRFEITIKRNDEGVPEVVMSAEVIRSDGSPDKIGTDIFSLTENLEHALKILKGRVGQNACEMFLDVMT
ncbi:MAG: hypothetical protein UR66_C0009G0081 [Candidatus Moranbacteria bacterium GW2011_GWE1_35_17]|nr:MAG: hypothetical protein UR66_C0009G0081 [Candidatus Moranbacteria bacterium GW2011_GWE1_35_17]KKP72138.1 MAG: hypothetical protein UR65_C0020G0004 [Candidatus Moranbacteria bacterium GW2011_GWE2_35_164]KKP83976.1 MAG: hypothetical protein UR83_C0029G0009 [Candidatus Moranbacteria bacterium GW2011_GWF2_35_54]KKP84165.1 MAG: hypothetical protein UR82_C0011G0013 [Candidatus Moranbacteria bacterium GW2011_GWF1_35_5]